MYAFSLIPKGGLIHSVLSIFWGGFVIFYMPDSPMRAKCFSEEDKKLLVERVRDNQTGPPEQDVPQGAGNRGSPRPAEYTRRSLPCNLAVMTLRCFKRRVPITNAESIKHRVLIVLSKKRKS